MVDGCYFPAMCRVVSDSLRGAGLQLQSSVEAAMKDTEMERWPFAALVCVCLGGLILKACAFGQCASTLAGVAVPTCGDFLVFLGGVGSAGLLCSKLFGPARVESTLFWIFLAGIIGAAILFCRGA